MTFVRLAWTAALLLAAFAPAAACSSFDGESEPSADGGVDSAPFDGSAPDAATTDATEAGEIDAGYIQLARGTRPRAIAVAGSEVFYADATPDGGVIEAVHIEDATVRPVTRESYVATQIAVSGAAVFWIDPIARKLGKVDFDGSRAANVSLGNYVPRLLTASTDRAIVAFAASDGLWRYDFALADKGPVGTGTPITDVAIRANQLVWSEPAFSRIRVRPLPDGEESEQLVGGQPGIRSVATDSTSVYWSAGDAIYVYTDATTTPVPKLLAQSQKGAFALSADDAGVYWLTTDGYLRTSKKEDDASIPPRTIASGFAVAFPDDTVQAVGLTLTRVVWLTSDGRILRATR